MYTIILISTVFLKIILPLTDLKSFTDEINNKRYLYNLMHFPNSNTIENNKKFLDNHIVWLKHQVILYPQLKFELITLLQSANESYEKWNLLSIACNESYSLSYRALKLKELEELLDEEDFQLGIMPPIIFYYREIK